MALALRDWARARAAGRRNPSNAARSWAACAGATGPRSRFAARRRRDAAGSAQAHSAWPAARWRRRSGIERRHDMNDLGERSRAALAADGPLAQGLPGYARAPRRASWPTRWPRPSKAATPGRRGRHRHRQDLRLSGAGAAVGPARDHLHRHARAAGPALPPRPAARARGAGRRPDAPRCSRAAPTTCAGTAWSRPRASASLQPRRSPRSSSAWSPGAGARAAATWPSCADLPEDSPLLAAGHLHRRELPRRRVPVLVRVLRRQGAPAGAGCRPGGGEPPPAAGRPGDQAAKASARSCPAPPPSCSTRRTSCPSSPRSSSAKALGSRQLLGPGARRAGRVQRQRAPASLASVHAPVRELEHAVRELRLAMEPTAAARRRRARCSRMPGADARAGSRWKKRWPRWSPAPEAARAKPRPASPPARERAGDGQITRPAAMRRWHSPRERAMTPVPCAGTN